jgi:hypothetical protein
VSIRTPEAPPAIESGSILLNVAPGAAQVYVDGYFAGVADDFGMRGRRLELEPGAHRISIRSPGYRELGVDLYIEPGRSMVYRGDLERLPVESQPAAATAAASAGPRVMYVIPNCYAGNVPPAGTLPKGCSARNLRTTKLN